MSPAIFKKPLYESGEIQARSIGGPFLPCDSKNDRTLIDPGMVWKATRHDLEPKVNRSKRNVDGGILTKRSKQPHAQTSLAKE